jgi:hypothetical protein
VGNPHGKRLDDFQENHPGTDAGAGLDAQPNLNADSADITA